jgi:lipoate-protein ligase A
MPWAVRQLRGTPAELHAVDPSPERSVLVMQPTEAAAVLGSTQPVDLLDGDAVASAGLAVARRRTGGGLVVVRPGEVAWVDVVIPVGDSLWRDDVGRAFEWLGDAWAGVLRDDAEVHRGAPAHADLGRIVCFAGLGSGEVSVAGRKVVGISQRRTRTAARFQCLVHRVFDAAGTHQLLSSDAVDVTTGERLATRLDTAVGTVGDPFALVEALVGALRGH